MPAPSYNYSLELADPISLKYYSEYVLNKAYPDHAIYFKNGENLPPGTYTIKYKTGAIQYLYTDSDKWRVNNVEYAPSQWEYIDENPSNPERPIPGYRYTGSESEVGFVVCYNPDGSANNLQGKKICTGLSTLENTIPLAIADSLGATEITIGHAGGPIAIYLHVTVPGTSSSSSASDGDLGEAISAPDPYSRPQFILIRNEDPSDYQCGDDAPAYHPRTFKTHFKRPGDNTFSLDITIDNSDNNSGNIQVKYNGVDRTKPGGGTRTFIANGSFTTELIPVYSGSPDIKDDELLEIIITTNLASPGNILNWKINVTCPACPSVGDPTNMIVDKIDGNQVTLTWTKIDDSANGIIYGYDLFCSTNPSFVADDTTFVKFIESTGSDLSTIISLSPGTYYWGLVSYSSCGERSLVKAGLSFEIDAYEVQNFSVRIYPVNKKLVNHVKLQWKEDSETIKSFKISRGHSYYNGSGTSVFDWVDYCMVPKEVGTSDYSLIIDLRKDADEVSAFESSPVGAYAPVAGSSIAGGFDQEIIRKIFLKAEDPSDTDTHHELWFRIEAISQVYFGFNSQFTMIVSAYSASDSKIMPLSQKTQYLFDQRITTSGSNYRTSSNGDVDANWDANTATPESGVVNEIQPLWIRKFSGFYDASRVAIDPLPFSNRQASTWINFRAGNAVARINIKSSVMMQYWTSMNTKGVLNPRGITIDSDTGDAYVTGGIRASYIYHLKKLAYSSTPTANTAVTTIGTTVFERGYGATSDKWGRVWIADKGDDTYIIGIPKSGVGTEYSIDSTGEPYGICSDFWGNIWYVHANKIERIPINPSTGVPSAKEQRYLDASYAGGCAADIPVGTTANVWVCHYDPKSVERIHFTYNPATNMISSVSSNSIFVGGYCGGNEGPHGLAVDSDNNVWAVQLMQPPGSELDSGSLQKVFKIYQAENTDWYISSDGRRGGLFVYNNSVLSTLNEYGSGGTPRSGNPDPTGPFRKDDPDHPMWHPCYDEYDTNMSYDVTQLHRYIAWKNLGVPGLRKFPYYDIGLHVDNSTLKVQTYSLDGYHVAVIALKNHPTLGKWNCYMYSDFIGSVSAFNPGLYPVTRIDEKYPPIICKLVQ